MKAFSLEEEMLPMIQCKLQAVLLESERIQCGAKDKHKKYKFAATFMHTDFEFINVIRVYMTLSRSVSPSFCVCATGHKNHFPVSVHWYLSCVTFSG